MVDRTAERRLNWLEHQESNGCQLKHYTATSMGNETKEDNRRMLDNVNEDIEAKKLTVQQATVLAWDRNKRKHQVAVSSSLKWWKRAEEEE